MPMNHRPTPFPARGVTLVELVVAIVIIGVALTGVLMVFVRNTSASADPLIWHQANAIAEAYLEEILAKNFDLNGPEAGESRATYDDVGDYNNLANNGCLTVGQGYAATANCPTPGSCACDQTGQPINGLQGYVVSVQVAAQALGSPAIAGTDAQRVQVTVTSPFGGDIVISGFRTNVN